MRKAKKTLALLLTLTMLLSLFPAMSVTAFADYQCPKGHTGLADWGGGFYYCPICDCQYDVNELTGGGGNQTYECPFDHTVLVKVDEGQYFCPFCTCEFEEWALTGGGGNQTHTHSWSYYKAYYGGNFITAFCENPNCPDGYESGFQLTINAPTNLVCDGSPKAATISYDEGFEVVPDEPSPISYNTTDGNAPTQPGTYTASFGWGGETASVTYTLTAPAEPETPATLTVTEITAAFGKNALTVNDLPGFEPITDVQAQAWTGDGVTEYVNLIYRVDEQGNFCVQGYHNGVYDPESNASLPAANAGMVLDRLLAGAAQNGGKLYYTGAPAQEPAVAVTGVTLDGDVDMGEGDIVDMTVTVTPNDATDKTVVWSVSGDAVALYTDVACTADKEVGSDPTDALTVYVKGLAAGEATVTVTSNADSSKSDSCTVTVSAAAPATVAVTGVTLDGDVDMGEGDIVDITATVTPSDATDKTVVWSVSGDAVALYTDVACTADKEVGSDPTDALTVYVKGLAAGEATVTVTSNADSSKSDSCTVTVSAAAPAQQQSGASDTLTRETLGVTSGYSDWSGKTATSGAVYKGNCAGGNSSIQLRSTYNSGIVTTASGGKATKVSVVWNGSTDPNRTLDVYGKDSAYSAASDLYGNNAGVLIGSIVCGTSTELTITGDYAYIGVRSNYGAMYLTSITFEWNGGSSAPATVGVESVSLPETLTLTVGGAETLTATVLPENATDKSVVWSSDNTDVATVENGVVTGVAEGTATITATTTDGGYTANCAVTVEKATATPAATAITIDMSVQGYENGQEVSEVSDDSGVVTVTFAKGTNSNAPKYYDSGSAVRLYGGSLMTVSAGSATITEIEITYGSGSGSNEITADPNPDSFDGSIWTGSASSVVFTVSGTSGNRRIQKLEITLSGGAAPAHTHAWTYAAGTDDAANTVTATCTEGCPEGYDTTGVTLSISAPDSLECDGSAKAAVISGYPETAPDGLAAAPDSIHYFEGTDLDGVAYTAAPTQPGTYTASFSWGDNLSTAYVTYTLTEPIVLIPQNDTETLDLSDKAVGYSVVVYDNGGKDEYSNNSDGKLSITPPAGKALKIEGSVATESNWDFLYVMGGSGTQLAKVSGTIDPYTLKTGDAPVTLRFKSDNSNVKSGFELTVTVIDADYSVSFAAGEGTGSMSALGGFLDTAFVLPSCTFTAPEGKLFLNWTDGTNNYNVGATVTLNEDTTFTAVYVGAAVASFEAGEGEGETYSFDGVLPGTVITLPENTFTAPEGQAFLNWTDGTNDYNVGATVTLNEDTTFTAVYVDAAVASFEAGEGEGETFSLDGVLPGGTVTLPACTFTAPEGKLFLNWTDGTNDYNVGATVTLNEDTTFTATWETAKIASFQAGQASGTEPANIAALPGASITLPSADGLTGRAGLLFVGWTVEGDENVYARGSGYTLNEDTVFTAKWGNTWTDESGDDSDSKTDSYSPTAFFYKYSLTQQIYTADLFGGAGTITALSFHYAPSSISSGAKTRTAAIYLTHTDKSSFNGSYDWTAMTADMKVFEGTVAFEPNAWTTITLDTPFAYNGTDNLLLCFDDNTGSYESSSSNQFWVSDAPSTAIRIKGDGTDYDPTNPGIYSGTVINFRNDVRFSFAGEEIVPVNVTELRLNESILTLAELGDTATLTATVSPDEATDTALVWTSSDETVATVDENGVVTAVANGTATVTVTATNGTNDTTDDISATCEVTVGAPGPSISGSLAYLVECEDLAEFNNWLVLDYSNGVNPITLLNYSHSGSNALRFSSYNRANAYDQYVISPNFGGTPAGTVSFYYAAYSDNKEKFCVGYSTTTNDLEAFTWSDDVVTAGTGWQEYIMDIPAGTNYVAIHYKSEFVWHLFVDDFALYLQCDHDISYVEEDPTTCAADGTAAHYHCGVCGRNFRNADGSGLVLDDNELLIPAIPHTWEYASNGDGTHTRTCSVCQTTESVPCDFETVTAENGVARQTCTHCGYSEVVEFHDSSSNATWDFEISDSDPTGYTGWTIVDSDGDGYKWEEATVEFGNNANPGHNGSLGLMLSASYKGSALHPDNWLISPAVSTVDAVSGTMSFWACAQDKLYPSEVFRVYAGNSTNIAEMTPLTDEDETLVATRDMGAWLFYEYEIPAALLKGQPLYVAIRHYNCSDMYYMDVDDVSVNLVFVPCTAHTLELVEAVQANCTEAGCAAYYRCTNCGRTFADDAAQQPVLVSELAIEPAHSLTHHAAVDVNCTEWGNSEYWECSRCNKCFSDEDCTTEITDLDALYTAPLGHNFVNGVCTRCGEVHEHSYGDPSWTWRKVSGAWNAVAVFNCEANDDTQTVRATITSEESQGVVTYTAKASFRGFEYTCEDHMTDARSYKVTFDGETVVDWYSWGELCTLSFTVTDPDHQTSNRAWFINGKMVADGRSSYTFAVTEDCTVTTQDTTNNLPQAVISPTIKTPANGKAVYNVKWSLPTGSEVVSAMIYRGAKSNADFVEPDLLISKGVKIDTGLYVRNGDFTLTISNLSQNKYQNVVTVVTYRVNGEEKTLIAPVAHVMANGTDTGAIAPKEA